MREFNQVCDYRLRSCCQQSHRLLNERWLMELDRVQTFSSSLHIYIQPLTLCCQIWMMIWHPGAILRKEMSAQWRLWRWGGAVCFLAKQMHLSRCKAHLGIRRKWCFHHHQPQSLNTSTINDSHVERGCLQRSERLTLSPPSWSLAGKTPTLWRLLRSRQWSCSLWLFRLLTFQVKQGERESEAGEGRERMDMSYARGLF